MLDCVRCGMSATHVFNMECYECFSTTFNDVDLMEEINHLDNALHAEWHDGLVCYSENDNRWNIDLSEAIGCIHILEEHDWMIEGNF